MPAARPGPRAGAGPAPCPGRSCGEKSWASLEEALVACRRAQGRAKHLTTATHDCDQVALGIFPEMLPRKVVLVRALKRRQVRALLLRPAQQMATLAQSGSQEPPSPAASSTSTLLSTSTYSPRICVIHVGIQHRGSRMSHKSQHARKTRGQAPKLAGVYDMLNCLLFIK